MLSLERIEAVSKSLAGRVRRTPVEPSPGLSEKAGVPVWLKLENLQLTGSFKVRGAFARLSELSEDERRRGVVTASAGNHGKGIAYVARLLYVPATIYVPKTVDESKYRGIVAMGAEAVRCEWPGYDETEALARREAARLGRPFISAFDDDAIMAGNGGSLAVEVLEDVPEARTFVLPVGGGGLAGGFAYYARERLPDARIVGCQHEASPALKLSLERGEAVTRLPAIETLAAGVEGGIGVSNFAVLRSRVDAVALVSEEEILDAVRWLADRHQYLVEPSGAAVVAAILSGKAGRLESPAAVVLSGRNVSLETLRKILA
ncbi:MAG TPA: pyridoxal-phosphate dependent enzyme [Thermoanaerobaculia bacterium]|jgi:threonine dehydratase